VSAFRFEGNQRDGYRIEGELGYDTLGDKPLPLPAIDGPVTVSLARLERVDSAGIAQLIAWRGEAQAQNADLRYTCVPKQLVQMVEAYGIQSLFADQTASVVEASDSRSALTD